jgi:hypothetical protein
LLEAGTKVSELEAVTLSTDIALHRVVVLSLKLDSKIDKIELSYIDNQLPYSYMPILKNFNNLTTISGTFKQNRTYDWVFKESLYITIYY